MSSSNQGGGGPEGFQKSDPSGLFCCGPVYTDKQVADNQLLKVPRVTTDIWSLLVLGVYIIFMLLVWFYSIYAGEYAYLVHGMDWRGQACGTGDLSTYPYQAWINPLMPNIHAGAICVDKCPAPKEGKEIDLTRVTCICNPKYWPEKFASTGNEQSLPLIEGCRDPLAQTLGYFSKVVTQADPVLVNTAATAVNGAVDQPCAFQLRTKWAMHKCVPWASADTLKQVVQQNTGTQHDNIAAFLATSSEIFSTFMNDVAESAHIVGMCMFLAVILSLVCIFALKYCTMAVMVSTIFGLLLLLAVSAVGCFVEYDAFRAKVEEVPQLDSHDQDEQSMYTYLGCFWASIILFVLHLGLIIYEYQHLEMAKSIITVATDAFEEAPQVMLYPLIHLASFVFLLSFWLCGAILLYSSGEILLDNKGVGYMSHTPMVRSAAAFYLYGLIWMSGFMNAMGYMIVAGTVYLCVFAKKPPGSTVKEVPHSVMTIASLLMIRYHMGTAALGSLVFSVIWPLRLVCNVFSNMGNAALRTGKEGEEANNGGALKYLCCCCQCCSDIWDRCLKFMNKMAFLQTVLHGYSFCGAAFDGLDCVIQGLQHVGPTTFISSFVLLVIKLAISLAVTAFADVIISSGKFGVKAEDLTYSWVPYLLVGFSAFVVCTAFMLIVEVAIDAVMVAFCEAHHLRDTHKAIKENQLPTALVEHMNQYTSADFQDGESSRPLLPEGDASKASQ